ncbi:hypothetical protein PR202_gb01020 [Eleusine coracana subsp. coracana]|uniref:SBP-type domain-containing protein n=1 Tax=Eleusine coracana subsp. coracana TaxID=191504 RepID=A0AAV5DUV8_ELECO|nr:hypothetical protein PR202_gb01020 [Eleusine coracana subsp. coracana]
MDAPDASGGGVDAGEPLWDWGNLLDFVVQEDDSLVLPWDDAAGIGEADPTEAAPSLLATPPPQPAEVEPDPEPEIEPEPGPVLPPPQLQVQGIGRRVRKRDPRLVCPNYLAGMVPCACPEVDEMAAAAEVEDVATELLAGARKKVKTAGRRGKAGADVVGGGGSVAAAGGVAGAGRAAAAEMRCQVPGCEADIRELKGYHRRHRVCLRCAHSASVMLDGVQKRYCQQCGKFHILLDFDEDKRSCRRKLERHNKRRRRKPDSKGPFEKEIDEHLDLSADVSGDGELREENIEGTSTEMLETVLSNKLLDRETPVGSEDILSSPTCTQPSLHNEQSKSIVTFAASVETCIGAKQESVKLTSSPVYDTKSAYSSSLSNDAANLLKKLVNSPNSLLLGFRNVCTLDGTTLMSTRLEVQAPRIHYVHPTWFEAGKPVELLLCGSSLDQPKFRYSFLSFLRVGFDYALSTLYQIEFDEVENVSGLSNFVPILFGSKQLCSELEKIQDILCGSCKNNNGIFGEFPDASSDPCERHKSQNTAMSGFLVDIGWLIKKPTPEEFKHALSLTNTQRWNTGLGGDNDLHSDSAACDEEVTTPLVTKDSSHRQCCHPDISSTWLKPSLLVLSFSTRIELGCLQLR